MCKKYVGIIQTTALIVFILLGCLAFSYLGFEFGYNKCQKEAVAEFNSIFEQGLKEGFNQGFEAGEKSKSRL